MKKIITAAAILCWLQLPAQVNDFLQLPDPSLFKQVSAPGWVKFRDSNQLTAITVFTIYSKAFSLTGNYSMQLEKQKKDLYGLIHYRYRELYNNIPVDEAAFILHEKKGLLISGNGYIFTPGIVINDQNISEETALKKALAASGSGTQFFWQNEKKEANLKKKTGNPAATYYPAAAMFYVLNNNKTALVLCYRFCIQSFEHGQSCFCFVNAGNGNIEKKHAIETSCDPTTFTSNFYGVQNLNTNDVGVFGTSYDLEDDCTNSVYGVYDATNSNNIFNTSNNVWTSDWQRSAATSLWTIKASYYWYKTIFGRNGHDNNDGDIDIYQGVNFGTAQNPNNNNANYHYDLIGDDEINVGIGNDASVMNDWNALDILAHEFTHGVTQYEANLLYEKESGALNESFSDIFGEWVEHKVFGSNDWYIGTDRKAANGCPAPLRSMVNPAESGITIGTCSPYNFGQPNTYQGSNWVMVTGCTPIGPNQTGNNDYCGVHTNSGVQNQFFYFLCQGGTGYNDGQSSHAPAGTGYDWSVTGIGIDKAIVIAYHVLNNYLTSGSGYADARNAWVAAAIDIYGECSFEAIQTGKAWYAVGIGPPAAAGYTVCGDYGSIAYHLHRPGEIQAAQSCTVNILSTNNEVRFTGSRVVLNPGFKALNGSRFVAATDTDCRFTVY